MMNPLISQYPNIINPNLINPNLTNPNNPYNSVNNGLIYYPNLLNNHQHNLAYNHP